MQAGSLSAQLRRHVTVVVAVLALLISVGTLVAARSLLYGQVDAQLDNAKVLQRRGPAEPRDNHAPGIAVPGMPPGTVVAIRADDGTALGTRIAEGSYEPLTAEAYLSLVTIAPDGGNHTVTVPGMGQYRVSSRMGSGERVVVAVPLEVVDATLLRLTLLAAGLGVVSVVIAAVATRAVADAATRPLRALSCTAHAVSRLELGRGEVQVPTPVPSPDLAPGHEVARLTDSFNRMLGNVRSALEARQASETKLRRFVADASHELRNPLAAIRGYSELAGRPGEQDTSFALGRIDAESRRLTKLVEDLLLLARLDADAPVEPQPVDVVAVVLDAVSDARVAGPDHVWRLELPEEGIEVSADADRLHQVVLNLLSNARIHTPAGTTVTTGVAVRDEAVHLVVADDGPGIAPEVLPHIFERFSRADTARAHSPARSTGLGLSIVQAVVRSFGGEVEVESRPGRTAFTVRLPLVPLSGVLSTPSAPLPTPPQA
ncbi:MAG: ATP-binding protein [Arachnia propionica]|uniref:HAMP domain-containing sensor histidine kinase n=1 Tax=Arachnia propionica TaxID=1750 RepID=UPI0027012E54|nr:ATP-binding protein [Arachnia propionica]